MHYLYAIACFVAFHLQSADLAPSQFLQFPIVSQKEHSMAGALHSYVSAKLPGELLKQTIDRGRVIRIIGAPPPIVEKQLKLTPRFSTSNPHKLENGQRPMFYENDEGDLVVAVMAGVDYLRQYTALIAYYVQQVLHQDPDHTIRVVRCASLEQRVGKWTDLQSQPIQPGDRLLIGNVTGLMEYLKQHTSLRILDQGENHYYKTVRVSIGGRNCCFLVVKYSFWGSIASHLVKHALKRGVSEVLYISKAASIRSADDLYQRLATATQHLQYRQGRVELIGKVDNPLAKRFKWLDVGSHISVPTVMEQDYQLADQVRRVGAHSLDCEDAGIAAQIYRFNQRYGAQVGFSPLHWITDYIRDQEEHLLPIEFDLANSRSPRVERQKKRCLRRIYRLVARYLQGDKGLVPCPVAMPLG